MVESIIYVEDYSDQGKVDMLNKIKIHLSNIVSKYDSDEIEEWYINVKIVKSKGQVNSSSEEYVLHTSIVNDI